MNKNNVYMLLLVLSIGIAFLGIRAFYIVHPGHTALHLRLGKFMGAHEESGFYSKLPLVDTIIFINNRICKSVIETSALSKDLQFVSIGVAINYKINDAIKLYQTVGTQFEQVIVDPFAQESIKAVVAQYTAEDLIRHRHEAKEKVFTELKNRLLPLHITLVDFNFVHVDFSPEFIKSVEEKQIAHQSAMAAKNITERVKEEALQVKARVEAEAYALNIKKEAVTADLIALKKAEALIEAIKKWDGALPKVMGATTPLLSVDE